MPTFLYYGLKAVQLTEMSNRVWKRTAEYTLDPRRAETAGAGVNIERPQAQAPGLRASVCLLPRPALGPEAEP